MRINKTEREKNAKIHVLVVEMLLLLCFHSLVWTPRGFCVNYFSEIISQHFFHAQFFVSPLATFAHEWEFLHFHLNHVPTTELIRKSNNTITKTEKKCLYWYSAQGSVYNCAWKYCSLCQWLEFISLCFFENRLRHGNHRRCHRYQLQPLP